MTDLLSGSPAPASADAVVVRCGDGRCGVDLASVAEVGRVPILTRVPGAPDWVAGVANWRGRILPVLDLCRLLGDAAVTFDMRARLLVVVADGVTLGLLVDRVDGTDMLAGQAEPCPPMSGTPTGLLDGQVPRPDGPIALLDVSAVVALRERLPRRRRPA